MRRDKRNITILFITLTVITLNSLLCVANDSIHVKEIDDNPVELRDAEEMKELVERYWHTDKAEVFRLAEEQDKFIFLLSGRFGCHQCQNITKILSEEPLLTLVNEEYILWHSNFDSQEQRNEIEVYLNQPYVNKSNELPLMHGINPKDPEVSLWGRSGNTTVSILRRDLTFNLPLNEGLYWHENKDDALIQARLQNKNIFRFIGRATSNNSVEMLKLLNENPLKQILQDNFILWYSRYEDPVIKTMSGEDEENSEDENIYKVPPYIYIIHPDEPDTNIDLGNGLQEPDKLKEMIEDVIVSNDIINSQDNNVSFSNNKIHISNKIDNELIKVYSTTGQLIYTLNKKGTIVTIDASSFPNGILIINSTSGWSGKVLKY